MSAETKPEAPTGKKPATEFLRGLIEDSEMVFRDLEQATKILVDYTEGDSHRRLDDDAEQIAWISSQIRTYAIQLDDLFDRLFKAAGAEQPTQAGAA